MSSTPTKADVLARFEAGRAGWNALLAEVGEGRMEQPGPMGEWTFKDLVAHLTGWRERTILRLEAAARNEAPQPPPWPATLTDDDEINTWIYEQSRDRPLRDVLADSERSIDRLMAAIAALPEEDMTTRGRFAWMEGGSLAEADFFGHLTEEHEPTIRAWLAGLEG